MQLSSRQLCCFTELALPSAAYCCNSEGNTSQDGLILRHQMQTTKDPTIPRVRHTVRKYKPGFRAQNSNAANQPRNQPTCHQVIHDTYAGSIFVVLRQIWMKEICFAHNRSCIAKFRPYGGDQIPIGLWTLRSAQAPLCRATRPSPHLQRNLPNLQPDMLSRASRMPWPQERNSAFLLRIV